MSKRERKIKESGIKTGSQTNVGGVGMTGSGKQVMIQNEVLPVQVRDEAGEKVVEVTPSKTEVMSPSSREEKENAWSLFTPDKTGRAQPKSLQRGEAIIQISTSKFTVLSLDEVEEGEIEVSQVEEDEENEAVGALDIMESDLMEDEILEQRSKEKDKSAVKKGGRKYQKTKAQEAPSKSKRSSRHNL